MKEELDATQEILDDKKLMESIQKGLAQRRLDTKITVPIKVMPSMSKEKWKKE